MCGIAGVLRFDGKIAESQTIQDMNLSQRHRGPDDEGVFVNGQIALGLARLSVMDTSENAKQPIFNATGDVAVVFNGEIYNFAEIKNLLYENGHAFVSNGDAEVLPHAYEEWGMPGMLSRLKGMFAFALWDQERESLFLVRDRLGVKPLCYAVSSDSMEFASEPHALSCYQQLVTKLDLDGLESYLSLGYTDTHTNFVKGVMSVSPACYLEVKNGVVREFKYWSLPEVVLNPRNPTFQQYVDEADALLLNAVESRMKSDVPLGVFLSAGIDSSLIAAYASRNSRGPIKTFTVDFTDSPKTESENESHLASQVANRYGTDHKILQVGADSIGSLPRLVHNVSEPFSDPSLLSTYMICKAAREDITVALTGDGGDESFAGYSNVNVARLADRVMGWCPNYIRKPTFELLLEIFPDNPRLSKIRTLLKYGTNDIGHIYDNPQLWNRKIRDKLLAETRDNSDLRLPFKGKLDQFEQSLTRKLSYVDFNLRLPCGYLKKVDIASSSLSMEIRSPFLDHELVEYMWNVPDELKIYKGRQKGFLRYLASNYLPEAIVRRKKTGFSPPISEWLRTRWRPILIQLVENGLARRKGYFRPDIIRDQVDDHLSLRRDNGMRLWQLICLEVWFQIFVDRTLKPDDSLF